MYLFELGREFKLSIAEVLTYFKDGKIIFINDKVLILDNIDEDQVFFFGGRAGGVIKIIQISKELRNFTTSSLILLCYETLIKTKDE
jgi:hypothetical protein